MSEIKGQLLGIILVLAIFGAVSAGLAAVFAKTSDSIATQVETIATDTNTSVDNAFLEFKK